MVTRELLHVPTAAAVGLEDWRAVDVDDWKVGRDEPHPDVRIRTSWLPVQGTYETLVCGDYDVPIFRGAVAVLGHDVWHYATRDAAQQGHADVVRAVRAYLDAQAVR